MRLVTHFDPPWIVTHRLEAAGPTSGEGASAASTSNDGRTILYTTQHSRHHTDPKPRGQTGLVRLSDQASWRLWTSQASAPGHLRPFRVRIARAAARAAAPNP